jgi:hypothetical protein
MGKTPHTQGWQARAESNARRTSNTKAEGFIFHSWGTSPRKNSMIHIDVSHSRQPLVKGERLVRYEVNTVMTCIANMRRLRIESNAFGTLA